MGSATQRNLYLVHCCVFVHEHISLNLCTHLYYTVQPPAFYAVVCVTKERFSLCHLSAVWRSRKNVGLGVSLRGVLQPSFKWEHTECTGQGPDI